MHALLKFVVVNVVMSKVAALQKCPHRRRTDDQLRDKMLQGHNKGITRAKHNTFCHIGRQQF